MKMLKVAHKKRNLDRTVEHTEGVALADLQ
jgi:hypothetical protein